jgi:hypothetical protein
MLQITTALDEVIEDYADTFRLNYRIDELGDPSVISEVGPVKPGRS